MTAAAQFNSMRKCCILLIKELCSPQLPAHAKVENDQCQRLSLLGSVMSLLYVWCGAEARDSK